MKTLLQSLAFVAFALIATSCANNSPEISDEKTGFDRSPSKARYSRVGDTLVIEPAAQQAVWLARADAEVIDGSIYLTPLNISSRGPGRIEVDLSDSRFPTDWTGRLFWVRNSEHDPKLLLQRTKVYRKPIRLNE